MVGAGAVAVVGVWGAVGGSRTRSGWSLCRHCGAAAAVLLVACSACWWVCSSCGTFSSHCRTSAAAKDHTELHAQPGSLGT